MLKPLSTHTPGNVVCGRQATAETPLHNHTSPCVGNVQMEFPNNRVSTLGQADVNIIGIGSRTGIFFRFSLWHSNVTLSERGERSAEAGYDHENNLTSLRSRERTRETLLQECFRISKWKPFFLQTNRKCCLALQTHMQLTIITSLTDFSFHHDHTERSCTLPRVYALPTPSGEGGGVKAGRRLCGRSHTIFGRSLRQFWWARWDKNRHSGHS